MNFLNRKKSDSVDILNKKGYDFNQLGEYDKAIECYDELLNVESNVVALKNKGYALKRLGKHEEYVECIQRASHVAKSKK